MDLQADWKEEAVPFVTISKGITSGVTGRSFLAIRTAQEWQDIWQQHSSHLTASPNLPPVDFSKEMVIAIFQGTRTTGGFSVEILRVEKSGEKLLVCYQERVPSPGSLVAQVLTQPYHIIKLQGTEGEVIFQPPRD
jgi:hypothetical protein